MSLLTDHFKEKSTHKSKCTENWCKKNSQSTDRQGVWVQDFLPPRVAAGQRQAQVWGEITQTQHARTSPRLCHLDQQEKWGVDVGGTCPSTEKHLHGSQHTRDQAALLRLEKTIVTGFIVAVVAQVIAVGWYIVIDVNQYITISNLICI